MTGASHSPPPKYCNLHFLEAKAVDVAAHLADVDDLRRLDFHQHAAGEIDAQVEALHDDRDERDQHQQAVHRKGVIAPADKIDVGRFGDKAQEGHGEVRKGPADISAEAPEGQELVRHLHNFAVLATLWPKAQGPSNARHGSRLIRSRQSPRRRESACRRQPVRRSWPQSWWPLVYFGRPLLVPLALVDSPGLCACAGCRISAPPEIGTNCRRDPDGDARGTV